MQSFSREEAPEVIRVVADALLDAQRHFGAFQDEPAPVADVFHRPANSREIHRAFAVEVLGVLGVEFRDAVPEQADLIEDGMPRVLGIPDVVVDSDGRRADAFEDLKVLACAELVLEGQDDAGLLGFGREPHQGGDRGVGSGRVVPQVALAEERDQDDPDLHSLGDLNRLAQPLLGARVAFKRDVVELADGEGGDGDSRPPRDRRGAERVGVKPANRPLRRD